MGAKKQGKEAGRLMMTGIRKGGEKDFQIKIFGNPQSQFPPLILKMSLHEMQQWLLDMRQPPPEPTGRPPRLRLVS